jgi:hypothetical protein
MLNGFFCLLVIVVVLFFIVFFQLLTKISYIKILTSEKYLHMCQEWIWKHYVEFQSINLYFRNCSLLISKSIVRVNCLEDLFHGTNFKNRVYFVRIFNHFFTYFHQYRKGYFMVIMVIYKNSPSYNDHFI